MPSLCSLGPFFTPKAALDDEGGDLGLGFARGSLVRAKTVKTSAKPPFVIQIFEPLRM
jgi:hypothetical protein